MKKIRSARELMGLRPDPHVETVYIPRRLSKRLASLLLSLFPNVKRIYVPASLLARSPYSVIRALAKVGVEVRPTGRGRGRPPLHNEKLKVVVEKYRSGEKVSAIARSTGIPLRTLFHILRKLGLRRRAPKHERLRSIGGTGDK